MIESGRATAGRLAREGWAIAVLDAVLDTDGDEARAAAAGIGAARGVPALPLRDETVQGWDRVGEHGITVNAVSPGPVDTAIMGGMLTDERKAAIS